LLGKFVFSCSLRRNISQNKTVLTEIFKEDSFGCKAFREEVGLPKLYITGGSSGSHAINFLVEKSLEKLLEKFTVIHQTGDAKAHADFEKLQTEVNKLMSCSPKIIIRKILFQEEVANNLSRANLVVGRSGINTVTELTYFRHRPF